VCQLQTSNSTFTNTDKEAADILCQYFHNVFTKEDTAVTAPCHEQFSMSFDDSIVLRKLQLLKIDKSPGPDGIHPVILKNCASAVVKPLSAIFQKSYSTGEVPAECRLETGCHITTV